MAYSKRIGLLACPLFRKDMTPQEYFNEKEISNADFMDSGVIDEMCEHMKTYAQIKIGDMFQKMTKEQLLEFKRMADTLL
jgi:hypothetical protein